MDMAGDFVIHFPNDVLGNNPTPEIVFYLVPCKETRLQVRLPG